MLIKLDTVTIASESDGTVGLKATKPTLSLAPTSTAFVGMKYARNSANVYGTVFSFSIEATRVFDSYDEAESFFLDHFIALSDELEGYLKYENALGNIYGFKNSVLSAVEVIGEVGISTTINYTFTCGEPTKAFPCYLEISDKILALNNQKILFNV